MLRGVICEMKTQSHYLRVEFGEGFHLKLHSDFLQLIACW